MVNRIWLSAERFLGQCRNIFDVVFKKPSFVEVVRLRHGGVCIACIKLVFLISSRLVPGVISVVDRGCSVVCGNTIGRGTGVMYGGGCDEEGAALLRVVGAGRWAVVGPFGTVSSSRYRGVSCRCVMFARDWADTVTYRFSS